MGIQVNKDVSPPNYIKSILILLTIFSVTSISLLLVYTYFPELEESERQHIKLPRNIEDAKMLGRVLSRYTDQYFLEVYFGILFFYIFLQAFNIPGSIFLSILSGFLFPRHYALALICFCSATGASFSYIIALTIGKPLVNTIMPDKVEQFKKTIKLDSTSDTFFSLLFLRITPILPNWSINLVSPIVDVPLSIFWLGTFLGVSPPSYVATEAGKMLYKLTSDSVMTNSNSVALIVGTAVVAILPVLVKKMKPRYFNSDL